MKNADKPIKTIVNKEGFMTFFSEDKPDEDKLSGLTKREYFAGLAMQGMLANDRGVMKESGAFYHAPSDFAEMAILCADELLKQLDKPTEN